MERVRGCRPGKGRAGGFSAGLCRGKGWGMGRARVGLTAEITRTITAYIRSGAYPAVAAEAAGVPAPVFRAWLARGDKPRAPAAYRDLRAAVTAAAAQARVTAELACFTDDPKTWLTKGPGRETAETPGWSGVVRPIVALTDNRSVNLLTDPTSSAILTLLLAALVPFPEARRAAIDALNSTAPRRVIPSLPAPACEG
jgi:hypothetical protein